MSKPRNSKVPKWATQRFEPFFDQVQELSMLLHLSMRGISLLRGMPNLVKALAHLDEFEGRSDGKSNETIAQAEREGEMAKNEVDTGFPVLHAQAVVTLWSFLEVMVRDIVADRLEHKRSLFSTDPIRKMKVRVGEYEQLEEKERYSFLAEILEADVGAGMRKGVKRFESLLEAVGLGGRMSEEIRETIYEFGQVRNVVAHRAGIADRQFVSACPWMDLEVGDPVKVTHEMYARYSKATGEYSYELLRRTLAEFNVELDELVKPQNGSQKVEGREKAV